MNQLAQRARLVAEAGAVRRIHPLFLQQQHGVSKRPICYAWHRPKPTASLVDSIIRLQSRSHTTNNINISAFQLPGPTWSLQELELSKQHAPISDEELQTLAKRALLDLSHLDAAKTTIRDKLRQDLGNMMHMIEQVQSFDFDDIKDSEFLEDQADIYDKPRGVLAAPLRRDSSGNEDGNPEEKENQEEVKRVFKTFLQPQTTKVGAHNYFRIETKTQADKK